MPFPRTAPADTENLPPGAALPVACCCVAAGDSTITVPSAPRLIVMNSTSVTARCGPCSTPGGDVQDSPPCTGGRPWSRPRPQRHLLDRARMQMRGNARAALEARPVKAPLGATSATQALPSPGQPSSGSHLARPPVGMSGASRSTPCGPFYPSAQRGPSISQARTRKRIPLQHGLERANREAGGAAAPLAPAPPLHARPTI
jgi:hypothetical protein